MAKKSDFEKIVKKTDGRVFLYLACFVLAAVMGYLVLSMFTKNDTFMMVNYASSDKVDCVLNMGDEYVEYGAQCVSFGKESERTSWQSTSILSSKPLIATFLLQRSAYAGCTSIALMRANLLRAAQSREAMPEPAPNSTPHP